MLEMFEDKKIRVIEKDGMRWVSAKDVCQALGYKDPGKAVTKLVQRNEEQLREGTAILGVPSRGGIQKTLLLNLNGVIVFCMKSDRLEAVAFQIWARNVLAREISRQAVVQAHPEYKEIRARATMARVAFTKNAKSYGCVAPRHFIGLTKATKVGLEIPVTLKKDEMDIICLSKVTAAESISTVNMLQQHPRGYDEIEPIVLNAARTVAHATLPLRRKPPVHNVEKIVAPEGTTTKVSSEPTPTAP